ncbi:MAG: hypothetical protein MI810_14675 [Flavobacteriales bacterium]|nr:hypothetical protein [Flavobacteriales bacterium]
MYQLTIDYLYNSANLRLYKKVITSTDTTEEYYLKSGSGGDIGIYDIKTNEWEWYVQGANRITKISPDGGQQPDSISYNGYPIEG